MRCTPAHTIPFQSPDHGGEGKRGAFVWPPLLSSAPSLSSTPRPATAESHCSPPLPQGSGIGSPDQEDSRSWREGSPLPSGRSCRGSSAIAAGGVRPPPGRDGFGCRRKSRSPADAVADPRCREAVAVGRCNAPDCWLLRNDCSGGRHRRRRVANGSSGDCS